MSQPKFVPSVQNQKLAYNSPPKRNRSWAATRPGETFDGSQTPSGLAGSQGPDQGFAIKLANHLKDQTTLFEGEHFKDVVAGCVAIALKRASEYRRAPNMHDMKIAFNLFGFLDDNPDTELVKLRSQLFEEVHHPHHYLERRELADGISSEFLHRPHKAVLNDCADWRSALSALI